jgi:UDP-N-acetylglucosamine 2-epimerase (non-hydrolysing)
VRSNTERPITIWEGTNKLIKVDNINYEVNNILNGRGKKGSIPKYWDGKSSKRIANILTNYEDF